MLYAVCENGGMVDEHIRHERFANKRDAMNLARDLQEIEDTLCGLDGSEDTIVRDLNRTIFDVVGVYTDEDGWECVITTEV